ncbi:MAG: hypothetical protein QM784_36325 [Polyangiaceae bacterium]
MFRTSAVLSLIVLPGLIACDSSSSDDTTTDAVTLVAIDSKYFPEQANCAPTISGALPGGAYVAELLDVSGATELDSETALDDFLVQVAPPVPCGRGIAFANVTENRRYEVSIRVYPDLDGDPDTVDVCTLAPTNVTMTRENGTCTSTLATPSSTLRCFGWAAADDKDPARSTVSPSWPSRSEKHSLAIAFNSPLGRTSRIPNRRGSANLPRGLTFPSSRNVPSASVSDSLCDTRVNQRASPGQSTYGRMRRVSSSTPRHDRPLAQVFQRT